MHSEEQGEYFHQQMKLTSNTVMRANTTLVSTIGAGEKVLYLYK